MPHSNFSLFSTPVEAHIFSALASPLIWGLCLVLLTIIRAGFGRTLKTLPYFTALICLHIGFWLFHVFVLKTEIFSHVLALLISTVCCGISTVYFTKFGVLSDTLEVMTGNSYSRVMIAITILPPMIYLSIADMAK